MKVLVIVEGIEDKSQIVANVKKSSFPIHEYDKIVRAKTEEVFDTTLPWYVKWIPKVNNWYDQYLNDVTAFFRNKTARMGACREVRHTIQKWQDKGYTVDVLSYSLGTMITLCCGSHGEKPIKVNNHYMFCSPIGLSLPYFGWRARSLVRKFGAKFKAKRVQCIYGSKDLVSKKCKKKASKIVERSASYKPYFHENDAGHDLVENINLRFGK